MQINKRHYRSIWKEQDDDYCQIIDQRSLPHKLSIQRISTPEDAFTAIKEMYVRGAPLIGVCAAYGIYFACKSAKNLEEVQEKAAFLKTARPTAVNLEWAIDRIMRKISTNFSSASTIALKEAIAIENESIQECRSIGEYGLELIKEAYKKNPERPVQILTHCNAGWLACVDYGTATAPMYLAHDEGIPIHVWVDETRPRNQGARITAFELGEHGIPHTLIVDNVGGLLMQQKKVDMVIVGSDRTARNGDVANKIGTYLKALAAFDNQVPFYVALPLSTFDLNLTSGDQIPIEERNQEEVNTIQGMLDGEIKKVKISPNKTPSLNLGFDITPAKYVTALITNNGICKPEESEIVKLFENSNSNQHSNSNSHSNSN